MEYTELISAAQEAAARAYSPYSGYKVGAAILCKSGRIFTGCNVENSSYGLTNCAERTAIFKAISEGESQFLAIAVFTASQPLPLPCGACRQVLSEFCPDDLVLIVSNQNEHIETTLQKLLPMSFKLKS
jgi:cytidine deaminase